MAEKRKICIAATISESFPKALVVFRGLEESLKAASEIGYDGVELALYHRDNLEVRALKVLLGRYGLSVPVVSTGQMYTMRNVSFVHRDDEVRGRAVREFEGLVEVAAELGADINVSRVRGSIDECDSYETGLGRLTSCLERVCRKAEGYGVSVLLEQMNRYETNYLHSCADVGDYIRSTGIPNLLIHADLFHMNIEDVNIPKTLKDYANLLGFIHFADSNRLAPGEGNIDFSSVLAVLREIGYARWIGIEILTKPDPYTAAKRSLDFLRDLEDKV